MKQLYKFRLKYLFTGVLTAILFFTQTWKSAANNAYSNNFYFTLTSIADTTPPKKARPKLQDLQVANNINNTDTPVVSKPGSLFEKKFSDSTTAVNKTDTFSLKISKDSIDAPVNYEAEDSAVVLIQEKKVVLYGKTKTTYKEIE